MNSQEVVQADPREGTAVFTDEPLLPGCGEADGGTDAGTLDTSVLVTADTRFHASNGTVTAVPKSLAGQDLELLIPQPNGIGFDRRTGTPVTGGMRFDNVPQGEYFLRLSRHYFLTRERRFDLGVNRVGRADAVHPPSVELPVQVDFSQLTPWQLYTGLTNPGSSLQVTSGDVDVLANLYFYSSEPPEGATSYSSTDGYMENPITPLPVLSAAKGDRLYVNQLSATTAGTTPSSGAPLTYAAVSKSLHMPAFDYTPDGASFLSLSGLMQQPPQTSFSLEWRLAEFTRWRTDANPSASLNYPAFSVVPAANGLQNGWVGYQGELLDMYLPRGEDGVLTRRLAFGNPYPSTWGVVGNASYSFRASSAVVVNGRTFYPSGSFYMTDRLDRLVAGPIQPDISPPREMRIDGVDAYVSRQVGANQPVVSWRPPVLGTPRAYVVTLVLLPTDNFVTVTTRFTVPGDRTQLRLPPDLLAPGSTYYLRVGADGSPNYEPWRAPYITAELLPSSRAETFSAAFTTP
ncbi:fibronectin type III domain-containing protein [Corallococcus sicarius]|uniref:Fibronectin type-III domain-containing protein n=1 Tax=Corallococcus sicarius TaxID=2316726 RepID=A0A3A8N9I9_9BACT|nr:fibronectin type III domain-containing protein [Corallococcus sicarius]RKH37795.1 hypothetical protein D7X12_28335 [Corallococcus sicarius]